MIRFVSGYLSFLLLTTLLFTATACGSWIVIAEQGLGWDDNFMRLSEQDQEKFESDASFQADAASIGSWRSESRIYLRHYRRINRTWRIAVSGNYRFNAYPGNSVNNYQAAMLSGEVRYGKHDRFRIGWDQLYDFYLRDYRHPEWPWYAAARFNAHTFTLTWQTTRLKPITIIPRVGFMTEQYAEPFSAYDLLDSFFGIDLRGEYLGISALLRYQLHLRDNTGFDEGSSGYQTTLDSEGGDASAREHDWKLQLANAPDLFWLKDITVSWRLRHRVYLTGSNGLVDPVHAGRIDRRQYLFCEVEFPLYAGFSLEAGWQYEWRCTDADWPALSDYKDYSNNRNRVNLKYRWYRK